MAEQNRICAVDGCDKSARARGFCNAHYLRLVRHGSPYAGGTRRGAPWSFIDSALKHETGEECITWPFSRNSNGYAQIYVAGKLEYVHRIVCERENGPAPHGHEAAHSCGNGHNGCISPRHLSWKTRAGNVADTLTHGTRSRGERHGMAVLSDADVREIRSLAPTVSARETSEMFGVSHSHVRAIRARKSWKWLE